MSINDDKNITITLSQSEWDCMESALNERIAYLSQILATRSRSAYSDHHANSLRSAINAKSALNFRQVKIDFHQKIPNISHDSHTKPILV